MASGGINGICGGNVVAGQKVEKVFNHEAQDYANSAAATKPSRAAATKASLPHFRA